MDVLYRKNKQVPTPSAQRKFLIFFWLPAIMLVLSLDKKEIGTLWMLIGMVWLNHFAGTSYEVFCRLQRRELIIRPEGWINVLKFELVEISAVVVSAKTFGVKNGFEVGIYLFNGSHQGFPIQEEDIQGFVEFMHQFTLDFPVKNNSQH